MHVDSTAKNTVEEQALQALRYLSDDDQAAVLKYIDSLVTLEKVKNDQGSTT